MAKRQYYYDDEGNKVYLPATPTLGLKGPSQVAADQGAPFTVRLPDPNEKSVNPLVIGGRILSGALPVAGAMAAGPLGTGAGAAISEGLKTVSPEHFGEPATSVPDLGIRIALPMAMDKGFNIANRFATNLTRSQAAGPAIVGGGAGLALSEDDPESGFLMNTANRLSNAFLGATLGAAGAGAGKQAINRIRRPTLKPDYQDIAEGMDAANMPLAMPNVVENPLATRIAQLFAPSRTARTFNKQAEAGQQAFASELGPAIAGPEFTGSQVQSQIAAGNVKAKQIKNAAWNKLHTNLGKVGKYPQIGAILGQTVNNAERAIEEVFKKSVPGFSNKAVRDTLINSDPRYEALYNNLTALKETQSANPQLLQNLKTSISEIANYHSKNPTKVEFEFRKIAEGLKNDIVAEYQAIDDAISGLRKEATLKLREAKRRDPSFKGTIYDFMPKELRGIGSLRGQYDDALSLTAKQKKTFTSPEASDVESFEASIMPGKNIQKALTDANSIRRTIDASADASTTRGVLGQQYLANIFDKAFQGKKATNTNILSDTFKNTKEQGKLNELFTPPVRQRLEKLGSALSSIPKAGESWGQAGNVIRYGAAGGGLLIGLADAVISGDINKSWKWPLGVLAVGVVGNQLAKRAILSDSFTKTIIRNAGTRSRSMSKGDSQLIWNALKGEQVYLLTPKGKVYGTISDSGEFQESAKKD